MDVLMPLTQTQVLGKESKMQSLAGSSAQKPHAVCVPYPAQGHINPMMDVAKLLHSKGFHVTFVNTVFNHRRLLRSRGPHALDALPSFRFETIPDGLPETHEDATQDIPSLSVSTSENCLAPFRELLRRINQESLDGGDFPPVSCIVSDGAMSFTLDAAEEIGVPDVQLWTNSACGLLAYLHCHHLVERGLIPLKDESYLTNGYLDKVIEWIPSMKNIRLKDLPSFIRTTNPDDPMVKFVINEVSRAKRATVSIINTFDALEHDFIRSISSTLSPIYPVGPLHLLVNREIEEDSDVGRLGSNLWKEENECLAWLDSKLPNDVVYVNFGSITVMTEKQLIEFAWGLAGSGKQFLWVIRPDLVTGDKSVLSPDFLTETAERGMLASWCPQEKVLSHPAIGGFLTHCGWNSTLETLHGGVPMICWPFFAEQQTNCKFCCDEWGVGIEIGGDVNREEVAAVIKELMDGEKGKKMKAKAEEWRRSAEDAVVPQSGSSYKNFQTVVSKVLLNQQ